ncbi:hypothetical protein ACQRIU_001972 [Beauveria bassiana]
MAKSCQSSDLVVEEKIREGGDHPMPVARPAHASVDAFRMLGAGECLWRTAYFAFIGVNLTPGSPMVPAGIIGRMSGPAPYDWP